MTKRPLHVVVSYSHRDELFRQQLDVAMKPLVREGAISIWSDHKIMAGSEIDREIQAQLKKADIVFLLVSPDFLNSDYCYCVEMETAIERHSNQRSIVVPIMLRHADWTKTPFSRLKTLPEDAKPISSWADIDEAWLSVVKEMRVMIEAHVPKLETVEEKLASRSITMRDSLIDGFDQLRKKYEAEGLLRDAEFGFPDLDNETNGITHGEVCLVAARPNSGLLDFCLNAGAWSVLKHKKSVFFVSTRQRSEKISQRLLSQLGRIVTHDLQRGLIDDDGWSRLNMAIKMLSEADYHLYDAIDFNLGALELALREQYEKKAIDLLIIDGLEYLSDGSPNCEQMAIKKLRTIARKFNVAVLANLTLGVVVEEHYEQRPVLLDLEEWQSFESDAEKILLLYRYQNYGYDSPKGYRDCVEIIVAKNDQGPKNVHRVSYFEEYGCLDRPRVKATR